MPNTGEKLIEFLKEADRYEFEEQKKSGTYSVEAGWKLIADHLIANGVTVQEWISVKDRLPKTGERVLVCIGAVFEAFIDDDGKWQRYYSAPLNEVLGEPTHWMPLPQPPKGE